MEAKVYVANDAQELVYIIRTDNDLWKRAREMARDKFKSSGLERDESLAFNSNC